VIWLRLAASSLMPPAIYLQLVGYPGNYGYVIKADDTLADY